MAKNTWQRIVWGTFTEYYVSAYSQSLVTDLVDGSITMSEYWKFSEGFKKVGDAYQYNIGQSSDKGRPSNYDQKVFATKAYGDSNYLAAGVYIGELIMGPVPNVGFDGEFYMREVYQITGSNPPAAPALLGHYYILVPTNGVARLTDAQGNLLNCDSSHTMGDYIQTI